MIFGLFAATAQAGVGIHMVETEGETLAATALSGNGQVVVGKKTGSSIPFRWTVAGGYEALAETAVTLGSVLRANHDGTAFIGTYNAGPTGFRWSQSGGYVDITGAPSRRSAGPRGISDDGAIVVGDAAWSGTGYYSFHWQGGAYTVFDVPETSTKYYQFSDVSGDGRYACAKGVVPSSSGNERIFRHDFNTGTRAVLTGSSFRWSAVAMSNDGNVITGQTRNTDISPYRWDIGANAVTYLGSLDPTRPAIPSDLSGDGSLVVGRSLTETGSTAFVWDAAGGMRSLESYIVEKGGALSDWTFSDAMEISDDGDAILATGSSSILGFYNGSVLITGLNQPVVPVAGIVISGDGLSYDFSFDSAIGQNYWLQGNASLGEVPWNDETTPVAGDGSPMTLSLPRANYPQPTYFFRLITEFAP